MQVQEMSQEFDILWDNIMSGAAPGLNEYEKSVFLTQAQEEIVKNYFNPKGNKYGEGAEDSKKRITDFSTLVKTEVVAGVTVVPPITTITLSGINILAIQRDSVLHSTGEYQVIPISSEEYLRLKSRPFPYPLKRQVWRVQKDGGNISLVLNKAISTGTLGYEVTYIEKPKPIILTNLVTFSTSMGITPTLRIDGQTNAADCALDSIIHREIIGRAVEIAKVVYTNNPAPLSQINTRNE